MVTDHKGIEKLLGVSMLISIDGLTLILWKMVEKKLFLQNQSINIVYPSGLIAKRLETIMGIYVCLI